MFSGISIPRASASLTVTLLADQAVLGSCGLEGVSKDCVLRHVEVDSGPSVVIIATRSNIILPSIRC